MNKAIIFLACLFLASCEEIKSTEENKTTETNNSIKKDDSKIVKIITNNNKNNKNTEASLLPKHIQFGKIIVDLKDKNGIINISSSNEFTDEINVNLQGELQKVIETDVDGDGFNEIYLVSNNGDIKALSSYRNVSFGEINIPKKPNSYYSSIENVKSWEVKNKKIAFTFESKDNQLYTVRYKLIQGEASYQLITE